jgi:ParB-like chromosome segregation protein Spo0J
MKTQKMKLSAIKPNPSNPRTIKDGKFNRLVESIKAFPQMLDIRPIVVNSDMIVLGGNMRLKACKEAGLKEVPVIVAEDFSPEQEREFIIKDNVGFGEWDWEMIANEWNTEELVDWGLDVWQAPAEVDYSILDGSDLDNKIDDMSGDVKKAIQIEFEQEHYEEAFALVKFWREQDAYVGKMILDFLKQEKEKL